MPGLQPSFWGPSLWNAIHAVAYAYEPTIDNQVKYKTFFETLGSVLPCADCRAHYLVNSGGLDAALVSKEALLRWTYDLHNKVNKQNGVPESRWPSYDAVKTRIAQFAADCSSGNTCESKAAAGTGATVVDYHTPLLSDNQVPLVAVCAVLMFLLVVSVAFNIKRR